MWCRAGVACCSYPIKTGLSRGSINFGCRCRPERQLLIPRMVVPSSAAIRRFQYQPNSASNEGRGRVDSRPEPTHLPPPISGEQPLLFSFETPRPRRRQCCRWIGAACRPPHHRFADPGGSFSQGASSETKQGTFSPRITVSICKRTPVDAHHLKFAQPRALGRKVSDDFTVPLCRSRHQALHRQGNEIAWWADM